MIGRHEEKRFLQSLVTEEEPQFVAVFGRRRIGKTYLVRESFDYHFTFQHTGVSNASIKSGSRKQVQLEKFRESLEESGFPCNHRLSTWEEAFGCLKEVIGASPERKKVVFIDELSWMDTKGSGLLSALESFWNGWATARREKDVVLIVCASATYWIMDNIVNARGGLHNRLTGRIHLQPFSLGECEEYLRSRRIVLNRHQILQCYMALGGVPYYWSLLRRGRSLPQNIDELFFRDEAPLRGEYDNLYKALFNSPDQYMKIVEELGKAGMGLTRDDLSRRAGIASSGSLSKKLRELENCGFIRRYVPFGYKKKDSLYQLMDNYTLFYYKFVASGADDERYWENNLNTPRIAAWSGVAFERVCLQHVAQIKAALGISGVSTEVNAWRCAPDPDHGIHGSQVDLLIVRRDQVINLCEMKYSEADYVVDAAFDRAQRRRISDFLKKTGTRYAVHSTLVTTYEVEPNAYTGDIQAIVTADDLFR